MPEYIVRCAWQDRFPEGTNLQDAARDSVIRYAVHFGISFRWGHDQYGERWKDGAPTGVYGWRSEAVVTGKLVA